MDTAIIIIIVMWGIGGLLLCEWVVKKRGLIHLIEGLVLLVFSAFVAWFKINS